MAQKHELEGTITVTAEARDVKQVARATEDLADKMGKLKAAYRANVETQDHTRQSIVKLTKAGQQAGTEWDQLHKDLTRLGATMEKQEQAVKDYARGILEAEDATDEQRQAAAALLAEVKELTPVQEAHNAAVREGKDAFDKSRKAIEQTEIMMERLDAEQDEAVVSAKALAQATQQEATMLKRLENESEGATLQLKAAANATLQLATQEALATQETQLFGMSQNRLKESLITALSIGGVMGLAIKGVNLIQDGLRRAAQAAKEFQLAASESFLTLQEEVARTKAQIPDLIQSQEQLYDTAVRTAREIGRAPLETQTATRKAMNLGLEYNDALEAVEISTKAARVANADMTETLITGMSTVNAYGRGMYTINEVLDQYAYVTQNSNLETQDLISGMAKIISPAAEAGVKLEEVGAAMIVMNRQGDDFTEIADLLGNMLTQLAVRGTTAGNAFEEAAGMGFREFTAQGGTLVEGLILLEKHAEDTEQSISELVQGNSKFYRDMLAGRGVLELTGRHTEELAQAYAGAGRASGTLAAQTAEFTGTLYYATEQMEAAKEQAYAVEGSLTKNFSHGLVTAKTDLYDFITELSRAVDTFSLLTGAAADTEGRLGEIQLRNLAQTGFVQGMDLAEAAELELENTKEIVRLVNEKNDISMEELEIAIQIFRMNIAQEQIEESIAEHAEKQVTDLMAQKALKENLVETDVRRSGAANNLSQKEQQIVERLERQALIQESVTAAAEARAEREAEIAQRLLEQRQYLGEAYTASRSIVENLSALQTELSTTTDQEGIAALEQQITDAGTALETHYKQNVIDAMIANNGYTASITDLAVEMGLITEEAGEVQKAFIRITTEGDKLGEMKGFQALDFEAQAIAAQALADGIAATAQEAFALVDPAKWREGVEGGVARAEEPFMVMPEIVIPEEDISKLDALEEQLHVITDPYWRTDVTAYTLPAEQRLNVLEERINEIVHDYEMTITINTVHTGGGGPGAGIPENSFAGGGSFTVPPGYDADNYLVGVSSGEHVSVTAQGQATSGQGVNLTMHNHFAPGVHNPQQVVQSTRDGLYQALEELGLT